MYRRLYIIHYITDNNMFLGLVSLLYIMQKSSGPKLCRVDISKPVTTITLLSLKAFGELFIAIVVQDNALLLINEKVIKLSHWKRILQQYY